MIHRASEPANLLVYPHHKHEHKNPPRHFPWPSSQRAFSGPGPAPADSRPRLAHQTPNTEHQICAFPFATSRLRVSQTACKAPAPSPRTHDITNAQNRSRARMTQPGPFVSIRGSKLPLAIIREHPCQSVAKNHPWHQLPRTRGLPSAARLTLQTHRADLGLESPATFIRDHSCPFVVQNTPLPAKINLDLFPSVVQSPLPRTPRVPQCRNHDRSMSRHRRWRFSWTLHR